MAKKETLVCRPCGTRVMVTDLGAAVVECFECGMELASSTKAPKKAPAAKKKFPAKTAAKKPVAKKPAPKKKK